MWSSASPSTHHRSTLQTYGLSPEMSMFVVAPSSFHHHHDSNPLLSSDSFSNPNVATTALGVGVGVGVGVIPLLATAPSINMGGGGVGGIHLWQQQGQHSQHQHHQQHQQHQHQPQQQNELVNFMKRGSVGFDQINPVNLFNTGGRGGVGTGDGGGGGGGDGEGRGVGMSSSGTTPTCQDCGNQAKKDCSHRRCRTCCRSRGFDCSTHVKSTWVPAARRRERQTVNAGGDGGGNGGGGGGGGGGGASSGSTSGAKKPRLINSQNTATTSHTSTSNTPPRSYDTSSSHQDASFKEGLPGQVRAPAVFKCVRVTAVDDGEAEYAYQAIVKIGGHVFKGFLYDHGLESREGFPNLSELHLGGGSGSGRAGGSTSSPLIDPPDVYGGSGGGLLGGSGYGNTLN